MAPIFIMMVGLPGSGKSTCIDKYMKDHVVVCSSDKIREELGNINSQDKNDEVFKILHNRIKDNLRNGNNVVYDATNISSKRRRAFLNEIKNISCRKICFITATPYEKCLENNNNRIRRVPEEVIEKMYLNWNTPYWFEGWDAILLVHDKKPNKDVTQWLDCYKDYEQNNNHHTFTLGQHCLQVGNAFTDKLLKYAGYLHDCGKPFTKSFTNHKGELCDVAHYYQHQCCGAYDSLFYFYDKKISPIDVSILINLHMHPYVWEKDNNEKLKNKYKKIWGEKLFCDVMKLHEADKKGH